MTDAQPVPAPEVVQRTIQAYLDAFNRDDRDAFVALFRPDALLEDPVGAPAHTGRDAIGAFWDAVHGMAGSIRLAATQRIVCGAEAAMVFTIEAGMGGSRMRIHAVDTFKLDAEGRIAELRAYWDLGAAEPVS